MVRQSRRRQQQRDGLMTALIYTRVSKDDQAKEGLSLPAQLQAARRYCADRGWIIGGEYQDVLSGTRDDRTGYQAVLEHARVLASQGKPVAVVVMRLDRLGRRLTERIRSREEFKQAGVVTHSVREGGEVSDLMANMLAVMAQEEVERLGDRVRDTREHNQQNGWHLPGRAPWGYRWRPATDEERKQGAPRSVLVIDEVTALYVREMFRLVASGEMTVRGAAVWVAGLSDEAKGIVTRSVRVIGSDSEPTTETEERARSLRPSAVRNALGFAVYVGRFEADDEQHAGERGRWQPIVDEATWDAVQRRLAATKGRTGPVNGVHLLTGMLRCANCGGKMSGQLVQQRWKRYRCASFASASGHDERGACKGSAGAKPIDEAVLARITALLAPLATQDRELKRALNRAWEAMRKPSDALVKERAKLVARATKDADDARRRIGDAARLLVDGMLDATAYKALSEAEQARLESAERLLVSPSMEHTPTPSLPPLDDVLALLGGWTAILSSGTVPEQRELVKALIETVVPLRIERGVYEADIKWTPLGLAVQQAAVEGAGAA